MRLSTALAILIGLSPSAFAGEGFDLVIPGRPGVPIIINGLDVSYAVIEGDFGLGKGVYNQPTIFGGRLDRSGPKCRPLLSEPRPASRLWPPRDRAAGEPQAAASRRELSSILVGAVSAASADIVAGSSLLSAARHPRPARWRSLAQRFLSTAPGLPSRALSESTGPKRRIRIVHRS